MPFRDDPQHWRDRAAQMGALAIQSSDPEATAAMLKLADEYDKLADRAAERAKKPRERKTDPRSTDAR